MIKSAYSLCINLLRMIGCTGTQLRLAVAMLFVLLATSMNVAHAQEAYATGFQSTLVYQGLNANAGVAVDVDGNVYVADYSDNEIIVETYQSQGVYTESCFVGTGTTLTGSACTGATSTLSKPYGVAVDANLNVYIADTDNGRVLLEKYVSPGVYTQSVIMASGNTYISSPTGIALDKNGNIYVTDPNTFNVIQLAAGTYTVTLVANSASTGLEDPNGVAVDSNLNIFIADVIEGVIEIPSTCTFPAPAVGTACGANTVSVIGSGISSPKGVGVDAQNSVYIASTGNSSLIKETIQASGGYGQTTLLTGLTSLDAVAVDASYNIYISLPSSEKVEELSPFDGNFGEVNIGSTSPVLTLTFDFLSGGEIGQILAVQKGATGSDFNLVTGSGAGTCAAGTTYDTGATCTVNVTFSPLYAGTRFGAVELMNADATPALFATAYIYGTGEGPQIIFLPGVDDYIYGNINNVAAVAVDGSDNIFVVSQGVAAVYEFTAASGYTDAIQFPGTSYGTLTDINTDGAGNVYISDSTNDVVYKFIAADAFQTVIAIDTGIAGPDGVAVDGFGNVFAASQSGGYVNEVLIESDYTIITQITTGSTGTSDIAVDGAGDLYVLNYSNGTVTEVLAVDGAIPASPTINTILTGLQTGCCTELESIKVDNVGNVYVADNNQATITEYYVAGGFSRANSMVVFPFPGASDMAIDGQGNIWASSGTVEYIGELSTGTAPSLYFDTTVGTPSAAQDVYIKNIGNETLTFPVEGSGNNPSISQYFTWSTSGTTTWNSVTYNDCPDATTSPQTLTVDTICGFPIIFDPTVSGAIDGSLVLTDNSGNYTGNTAQTVYLYGNATGPVLTVTATSFIIGTNGPAPTLEYTTDGSLGAASCTGTPTLTSNLPGATPYTETNPPIAGGITPYVVTITAGSFKCSGAGYPYSSVVFVNGTIEVGKNTAQLTLTTQNATMSYGQPIPTLTYTLTGFKGSDTQALDCTGAPTITTIATSSSPPGTYKITGDAGTLVCSSANYTYTITVLNSGVLTITMDTPTISWSPSPTTIAPGTALTAGELDAIADDGTTNVSADGTFVYYYHHGGTNTVVTAGYTALPNGTDELCAVWTPLSGYTADFNATAAPTANCVNITVTMNTIYTVTANNETITYGTTPPATYAGYTVSPTLPAACTGTVTYTLSPAAAYSPDPVGSYLIVPAGITCTGTNSISYVDGTLTVNQDTPILAYTGSTIVTGASLSSVPITVTNSNNSTVVTLGGTIAYKWNGISETSAYIPSAGSGSLCEVWTPSAAIDIVGTLSYASQYNSTVSTCETVTVSGTVALTLTTSNMSVTYGTTPNVTTDYTLTGFIGGDTQASACTGAPSLSTTATNTSLVSPPTYPVTATIGTLACSSSHATYTVTIVNTGVVTITKETVALTLTSANGTSVYGTTPNVSADYTLTGFVGSDTQASVCTGAPSVTTTATATSPVSPPTYPITAAAGTLSCTGDSNVTYTISIGSNSGVLTVTKASVALTLTTTNGTGAYGTTPAVTTDYTLTGFVGTDTQANACSGAPTVTTTATNTSPVSPPTYPISAVIGSLTCTRDANVTYTITIVNTGVYTVTQETVALTLTSANGTSVYGTTPNVSADYTLTGFVGSDTQASVCTGAPSVTTTATATSPVSPPTYPITAAAGTLSCTGDSNVTYTISIGSNSGKLTITKESVTLTLTTTNGTGAYGTTPAVTTDYTLTGFVGTDTQANACFGAPTVTTTATNTSAPGTYPISAVIGSLTCTRDADVTYTITIVSTGIYTVTQATANLTLTTTNGTGVFGSTPVVSSDYTLTGFHGSDTQANSCTGAPSITTTATNTSNVGTYTISGAIGTLVCDSTDYIYTVSTFTNNGKYTVTKYTGTLTLTTTNGTGTYGTTPVVTNDYTLTGFVGGQTQAGVCTHTPSITTTATNTSVPGNYPISGALGTPNFTCSNTNATYTITFVNTGIYTVTQASANLTLTSTNGTGAFGTTPNVASDYSLTGFQGSDTQANSCTGAPGVTTTATNTSNVGTYPITAAAGTLVCSSTDYTYTIVIGSNAGLYTVTKATATLTLTTGNISVVYGNTPNVAADYTLTGFIGGQTSAVCSGSPVITTTATNTSPVSPPTYPVTETGLGSLTCSNSNVTYNITNIVNTGVVTITQATANLTLTTTNVSSPFGSTPNVANAYTLTGFIDGQTSAVCSGSPVITTTATNTSPVSPPTYPITETGLGTLVCGNADVSYTITTIVNTGVVTITKASANLTLTTTNVSSVYGSTPNVANAYTLTGFIGGQTSAVCSGSPVITTTATNTSPVSPPTYPITETGLGTLTCSNADVTYTISTITNTGVVTITPTTAALTLTTGNISSPFGSTPNVAGDYTLTGFIGGQTSAVCSGSPIISTTATNTSPVSPPTYPVVATSLGTLTCSNADVTYTITIVNSGVVTVTQATGTLTLTSTSATSTYGTTPNVSADYTLTGFIGTDTQALACGATVPTVTTTATATSPISPPTYPITAAVGSLVCSDANATYSIVLGPNTGVLTIVDESGSGSQPNNFGSVPVNTTSSPLTVTFTFSNNGVIGSTKVLTTGITGLDFADVGTGTCDTNGPSYEYTSGSTCTMIVTFTPEYPGQRIGAVELLDGDGNLASTALLAGIGTGPDTTFAIYNGTTNLPATVTTVGSGFTKPTGLAVDAQGDVFVTDAAANTVSEVLAAGGYTTIKTLGSGFSGPAGVVIDGAGNLYVSDSNNNKVKEIVADGGYTTVKTLYTSASGPGGIAIDASGNLFITYPNSGTAPIVELTVASGYTTSIALDAGKFTDAGGIAIDNSGNLWVTDTGNNSLDEVTFASSYATVNVVNSSLTAPTGISLDSNANAYVDQGGATSVTYLAAPAYSVPSNYGSVTGGVYYGLALDGAGDIFAIDGTSNAVEKLNYSVAPTLIFASTPYDVTSPDSPQTVTLFNFGNAQLTLPIPATGNDASITTSFTLASGSAPECPLVTSSSANPGTLSASTSCTFPVSFTPLSVGSITGQLTLTDNNLNVSGSTQIINLNGTATAAAVTLTLTTTSISLPYGSVIPSVAGDYTLTGFVLGDSQGADCTGAPSLSTAATSTSPVGAYPITATIGSLVCSSANATYTVTIVNSGNVNITQATTDITWTPASIVYGNGLTAAQLDAQAFAGPSNVTNVSADGTFAYTYLGNPITTGTVLPYGSDTICVTFTPSAGYTADLTTASTCVALNVTQAPLTITATPYATAVYDTAVPNATFTYTIAGWVGTDTQNNVCTTPAPGGVTLSTPATDGSPVGIYTINVTPTMTCNGYYFVINTGELHITPAILTIVPVSTTVDYAQQVPTYSYNCYLNGTLEGTNNCGSYGITGGPTLTTTATIRATTTPGVVIYTSPIGTYTMNASLGSLKSTSANYTFGFGTATLIINPTTSDLTAKAGSYTINACAAVPTLTYTTSGYIDFDSAATQLTGTPNLQVLGLTSTCTAGTYTIQITAGSLAQTYGNYAGITYVNGTLTVR